MSTFSTEEVAAGEKLYKNEIFSLFPALGMLTGGRVEFEIGRHDTKEEKKRYFLGDCKNVEKWFRRSYIEYEYVTNVARYFDIMIKCQKGSEVLGERYLMDKLAANIDTIKRLCNKSVGNEILNPCDFTYGNVSVNAGVLENPDNAVPLIRSKYLPALLGSSGTTKDALAAYEYGIALALAAGLTYEWIYCLVYDSFLKINIELDEKRRQNAAKT